MPYRPPLSTIQLLQCLRIRDELLVKPFDRFQRLSRAQRRQGCQIPGPLEYRRRAAKRRHGAVSAAGGGGLPLQEFGALFGFKLTEAPRPDFENSWEWKAPVSGSAALAPRQKDHGDWRPWMRPAPRRVPDWEREIDVAQLQNVSEDPIEVSRTQFEDLLNACDAAQTPDEGKLRSVLDFLQGASNDSDARLTLRLIQWLGQRELTVDCIRALATVIAQKCTLRTMSEEEETAVFMELLQRSYALPLISSIFDSMTSSSLVSVGERVTAAILATSIEQKDRLDVWLHSLLASAFAATSSHNTSETWAAVYAQLAQHCRIADLTDHFQLLEDKDFAMVVLKYWVPRHVSATANISTLPREIEFTSRPMGWVDGEWHSQLIPHFALADLFGTLIRNKVPCDQVLREVFAYWQKTLPSETMCTAVWELQRCGVQIQPEIATPVIRALTENEDIGPAIALLNMLPATPVGPFQDLILKYLLLETPHGDQVWRLIDRWVEQVRVSGPKGSRRLLPPNIINFVHRMAGEWAQNPHLRPRVAFRRVWECYRFLIDFEANMYPSLSGAFIRAGVINYVQNRQPLANDLVNFVLMVVQRLEGPEVKDLVDKMVFDYCTAFRQTVAYKSRPQRKLEKRFSLQWLEDESTFAFRPYRPRVRTAVGISRREKHLFEAGEARDAERREEYGTYTEVFGDLQTSNLDASSGTSFKANWAIDTEGREDYGTDPKVPGGLRNSDFEAMFPHSRENPLAKPSDDSIVDARPDSSSQAYKPFADSSDSVSMAVERVMPLLQAQVNDTKRLFEDLSADPGAAEEPHIQQVTGSAFEASDPSDGCVEYNPFPLLSTAVEKVKQTCPRQVDKDGGDVSSQVDIVRDGEASSPPTFRIHKQLSTHKNNQERKCVTEILNCRWTLVPGASNAGQPAKTCISYLVRWKDRNTLSWEPWLNTMPESHNPTVYKLVRDFHKRHPEKPIPPHLVGSRLGAGLTTKAAATSSAVNVQPVS